MKKCPNCHSLNDAGNVYCGKCGYNFSTAPRSTSFRNFIIITSVFFSAIIIGLTVFFVLNSDFAAGILSGTLISGNKAGNGQVTESGEQAQGEISGPLYSLSSDQERLIGMFGYPDSFTVLFDEGNSNKRIDCWSYADIEACYIFEDGTYSSVSDYIVLEPVKPLYEVKPQQFFYPMSLAEVKGIAGESGTEKIDDITDLKQLIYGQGELICVFNSEDILIIVNKNIISGLK